MPQSLNEPETDDFAHGQYEPTQRKQARQTQRRIRNAEAQKIVARAMEKNARHMLWSVILASATTILTAAAAVLCVLVSLPRAPH